MSDYMAQLLNAKEASMNIPSPPVGLPTLLPCPFCGAALDYNDDSNFQTPDTSKWGCVGCGCMARGPDVRTGYGPVSEWKASAAAAWNERAERTPVAAEGNKACELLESFAAKLDRQAQALMAEGYEQAAAWKYGEAKLLRSFLTAPAAKGRETDDAQVARDARDVARRYGRLLAAADNAFRTWNAEPRGLGPQADSMLKLGKAIAEGAGNE